MSISHGAMGLSTVCDCGIPWSYSLSFMVISGVIKIQLDLFIALILLILLIFCMQNIIYFNPFCHRGIVHADFCVNSLKNVNKQE